MKMALPPIPKPRILSTFPGEADGVTERWQSMLYIETIQKHKVFENQLVRWMLLHWAKRANAASHQASMMFSKPLSTKLSTRMVDGLSRGPSFSPPLELAGWRTYAMGHG
jgi:hypothetical protein